MTTPGSRSTLDLSAAPDIPGLTFRRPRDDDADYEAMAALTAAANAHDGIPYRPSAANVREELEGSDGLELRADLVIAEVGGRAVAEAGVERGTRAGIVTYETWGHVDPGWRQRGIGRALLRENVRRATERSRSEPPDVPVEARTYVYDVEADHRGLVESEGFEPIRYYFTMIRRDLADIPDAPLPDGLELRPPTADQHRVVWEADNEAFRDHWQAREPTEADYAALFAKEDLDTSLWVVAWDGDEVAGVVQPWIWKHENQELGVARGWLEHISVRRPWRGRGLGRALTAEGLRRLRAAGMTEAMLGVDAENPTGALGLYERLGFEVHQRTTAYRLELPR